jgi:hypothetical protein
MELDELKLAWRSLDAKVDAGHSLQAATMRELKMERAQSSLRPLVWLIYIELALGIAAVLLLGAFTAEYWRVARYSIPGAVLHICAILTIVNAASQLTIVGQIDYSGPVVISQRHLMRLTARRARAARWQLLLAPLLWVPLSVVVGRGVLDFDIYRVFGWAWVSVNLAFGVAMIPVLSWVTRRFGDWKNRSSAMKTMADHIAGRSLDASMNALEEIASFERMQRPP